MRTVTDYTNAELADLLREAESIILSKCKTKTRAGLHKEYPNDGSELGDAVVGDYGHRCKSCHRSRCGHVEAVMTYDQRMEYESMLREGI